MSNKNNIDYGPLTNLIGVWKGDKGTDIAPDPDCVEINPYYETITFSAIGDVDNAEKQKLTVLHYRQIVQRKSNDKIFHDETGYWMWDAEAKIIMHSLTIPRGVSVLAGGDFKESNIDDGAIKIKVAAGLNGNDWQIIQSPFMQENAKTTAFSHHLTFTQNTLTYMETTTVEIYGKTFDHIDQNELNKL